MSTTRAPFLSIFLAVIIGPRHWATAEQPKAAPATSAASTEQPKATPSAPTEQPKAAPATATAPTTEQPKAGQTAPFAPSQRLSVAPASSQKPKVAQSGPSPKIDATKIDATLQSRTDPAPKAGAEHALVPAPKGEPLQQPKLEAPTAEPLVEATATPAPSSSSGLFLREPSLYETGRVGKMGVSDSGVRIKQTQDGTKPKELRVDEKASAPEDAITGAQSRGLLNAAVLGREIRPRFALLKDCRIEVARQKRIEVSALAAGSLTLRWTVLQNGRVADTQVVATSPVDGRIIDCVKRQMSFWSFSPPTGGAARVERPFKFQ